MELSWTRRVWEAQVVDLAGDFRMSAEIVFMWRSAEKYWHKITRNPCLCAAVLTCQWDVFFSALFNIHCVWCQMPWPNHLATCLSQICLSWFVQEWICSTCLGVCVFFSTFFCGLHKLLSNTWGCSLGEKNPRKLSKNIKTSNRAA